MKPMTAKQYVAALEALGMTQRGAARFLGIDERTSRRWANNEQDVHLSVALLLRVMVESKITPEEAYQLAGLKVTEQFSDQRRAAAQ